MLPRKSAAIALLVALIGANTAMASVCEAYCAGVGKKTDHHHQALARSFSPHQHMRAQQHRADCPRCLKTSVQSSPQLADCGSFTPVQVLQENSRVFTDDHAVSHLYVANSPTGSSLARIERKRFSPLHSPPNISSFQPIRI